MTMPVLHNKARYTAICLKSGDKNIMKMNAPKTTLSLLAAAVIGLSACQSVAQKDVDNTQLAIVPPPSSTCYDDAQSTVVLYGCLDSLLTQTQDVLNDVNERIYTASQGPNIEEAVKKMARIRLENSNMAYAQYRDAECLRQATGSDKTDPNTDAPQLESQQIEKDVLLACKIDMNRGRIIDLQASTASSN